VQEMLSAIIIEFVIHREGKDLLGIMNHDEPISFGFISLLKLFDIKILILGAKEEDNFF